MAAVQQGERWTWSASRQKQKPDAKYSQAKLLLLHSWLICANPALPMLQGFSSVSASSKQAINTAQSSPST
jgi:hypothetical protein